MAVVGLPTVCPARIPIAIQKLSPTDPALDGSMWTIVHEIAETVTRTVGKTSSTWTLVINAM
jgi:hypothetical protein